MGRIDINVSDVDREKQTNLNSKLTRVLSFESIPFSNNPPEKRKYSP
jgi:hypothetical protein